jgi:hypothetical protein
MDKRRRGDGIENDLVARFDIGSFRLVEVQTFGYCVNE